MSVRIRFWPGVFNGSNLVGTDAFLEFFRYKMDRLEEDLRFFKMELERENDPYRRSLLLERIAITEQSILSLMVEERERLPRQNSNMEKALAILLQQEEDKKK